MQRNSKYFTTKVLSNRIVARLSILFSKGIHDIAFDGFPDCKVWVCLEVFKCTSIRRTVMKVSLHNN